MASQDFEHLQDVLKQGFVYEALIIIFAASNKDSDIDRV